MDPGSRWSFSQCSGHRSRIVGEGKGLTSRSMRNPAFEMAAQSTVSGCLQNRTWNERSSLSHVSSS